MVTIQVLVKSDITWLLCKQYQCIINIMLRQQSLMTVTSVTCPKFPWLFYNFDVLSSVHGFLSKNIPPLACWRYWGISQTFFFFQMNTFYCFTRYLYSSYLGKFIFRRTIFPKLFDPTFTWICITITFIFPMNLDMMCTVYPRSFYVSLLLFWDGFGLCLNHFTHTCQTYFSFICQATINIFTRRTFVTCFMCRLCWIILWNLGKTQTVVVMIEAHFIHTQT